ncbi:hypothetical protein M0802_008617 [Mischocyttarus mexicanus]|nr:hypothetical protein M0802_008617 [Mischocyttarus mexicanus]
MAILIELQTHRNAWISEIEGRTASVRRKSGLLLCPLVNVSVVEGKSVELPCDITPSGEDILQMIFWFKDEAGMPLYTYYLRVKIFARPKRNRKIIIKSRLGSQTISEYVVHTTYVIRVFERDRSKSRTSSAVVFPVKPGRGDLGDSSLDYDGVETGQGSCPSLVSSRLQVTLGISQACKTERLE